MNAFIKLAVALAMGGAAFLASMVNFEGSKADIYHSEGEMNHFRASGINLPLEVSDHFMGSGNCDGCHGFDETGQASVDAEGNDISPVTTWRATMMANSARDPFFLAKMSHESLLNPQHSQALEDKCTSCHAPLGRFTKHLDGLGPYGLADLMDDPLGQDGVSCMGCHKQTDEGNGTNHSGQLFYDEEMREYGPYQKPLQGPMQGFVLVSPEYGEHVTESGFCAGCHTLLTESVDLDGNFTGTTFVEQATYHEWLNSDFSDTQGGTTCQGCHIPRTDDPVLVSAYYQLLSPRTPYGKHELVGGNTFMLKLMKANRLALDLRANEVHFDSTIARTERMLRQQTLQLQLSHHGFSDDTAYFSVMLRNLAGHKFPSGFPSRRAYIEFVVMNGNDTIFTSGVLNADHDLMGEDPTYEPHHDRVVGNQQVQIYEMVMGDVNGNPTTVLERAYQPLKDNRLVPRGFSTAHPVYDTTAIAGHALLDPNFNFDGFFGSGSDEVRYHVPLNGAQGNLNVSARVYYQAVPKKWLQDMFAASTAQIDTFRNMFDAADHSPSLVAADSLMGLFINTSVTEAGRAPSVSVFPNPTSDVVRFHGIAKAVVRSIEVFNGKGKLVHQQTGYSDPGVRLPAVPGIYFIRLTTDRPHIFRVVRK